MRKLFFLLFVSLFFITGCDDGETSSPKCPGTCNPWQACSAATNYKCVLASGKCRSNADCENVAGKPKCGGSDGYTCVAEDANPCDGVTCSGQGTCAVVNNAAKCNCNIGYEADGLNCVENKCNGVSCSNHGTCVVSNGNATCDCHEGYHADGLNCVVNSNPCDGVTCSGHGSCSDTTGSAVCTCDSGYYVDGLNCLKEGDPCDGVTCSSHGTCANVAGNAVCNCESGYHADGLKCIQDSSPCDSVNCGNGLCVLDNNQPKCNCNDGYVAQELTCVKVSSPCDGQLCSNKGQCENIDGTATCNCDDGYEADGLACVKVPVVDWCKVVGPTTINVTVGDEAVAVYAQIFAQTLTEADGANDLIVGGLGYTTDSITYPINKDQFTWVDATYNESCSNCGYNDEYSAQFPTATKGLYSYLFRFSVDGGTNWSYCDVNSIVQGENINPGTANVSEAADPCNGITCSDHGTCSVVEGNATCNCEAGYTANGTTCEENTTPTVEWCNVQSPKSFTALVGSEDATKSIYGQVFIPGVTENDAAGATVKAEVGYSTAALTAPINPGLLEWKAAIFNQKAFNNHEYMAEITFDKKGVYNYIYRFSADNGATWSYCHVPGVVVEGSDVTPGVATINGLCDNITCSDHGSCSVVDGRATCTCEAGYDLSDDKLSCIEQPKVDWCVIQAPKGISSEVSDTPVTVYGRVYVAGITEQSGVQSQIKGQLGYLSGDTIAFPIDDATFTWVDGTYNETCTGCGNNDEYAAEFPMSTAGNFRYLYRFTVDSGKNWTYCDQNGVVQSETFTPGIASVNEPNSPCDGITCNDHGTCTVESDVAVCNCEAGYHATTSPAGCEKDATPEVEWCKLISPTEIRLYTDDTVTVPVYSQVLIPGVTNLATENTDVMAQQGYMVGEITSLTSEDIEWVSAVFFEQKYDANHEYVYNWTYDNVFNTATTVEYIYRFSANGGQTWTYCDANGMVAADATEADINGGQVIISERPVPTVEWCNVQSPQHINALTGDSAVVYGQVYINGVTTEALESADVKGEFAITADGVTVSSLSDITALTTWSAASFNTSVGNNHEYMVNHDFTTAGAYQYFYRFSADGGSTWTYCDIDGIVAAEDTIVAPGTASIVDPINPCDGVTCSDHGTCGVENDAAVCTCEDGYNPSEDKLSCIAEAGPEVGWCVIQYPKSFEAMVGDTVNFYGRVYVDGITNSDGNEAMISAQLGVRMIDTFPENGAVDAVVPGDYNWEDTTGFNARYGNNYEYELSTTFESGSVGNYLYLYRFSVDSGSTWTYCDVVDQVNDGETVYPGQAVITAQPGPCDNVTCSGHGTCVETNGEASCNCDDGYIADGLTCNPEVVVSVGWCNVQSPQQITATAGASETIYGQVYVAGVTTGSDEVAEIQGQFAMTADGVTIGSYSDLSSLSWSSASFNVQSGNNHEYMITQNFSTAGSYEYYYRFSADGGSTWTYCDTAGVVASDATEFSGGTATINPGEADPCENIWCSFKGGCKVDENDQPYCDCTDVQYKTSADGLDCIHVNHTYHTPSIDGVVTDWAAQYTDMGDGMGDGNEVHAMITWDADNLYIALTNKDFSQDSNAALEIYLDDYKGYDLNNGVPYVYDHTNGGDARSLPGSMTADWYISVSQNGGKLFGFDTPEAGSPWWSATGTPIASEDISFSGGTTELVIPLSALNLDSDQLAVAIYLTDTSSDYVYGVWPASNAKGANNVDASGDQHYQFSMIEDQQPNSVDNLQ